MFEKLQSLQGKKKLIKVIAGILLLAVAFCFYLGRDQGTQKEILITGIDESENSTTSAGIEVADLDTEMVEPVTIIIDVGGAVINPSVVHLEEGSRIYEAIGKAGGLTADADIRGINQAQLLLDGEKIYIPTKQELEAGNHVPTIAYSSSQAQNTTSNMVNINTADSATLQNLSGVGPATAEKIINYRNSNGPFKSLDDLKNVSGIGEKSFEKLKDQITH